MDKLTTNIHNLQKAVDLLKNTECSSKEKIALFGQIVELIQAPSVRSNSNYLKNYLPSAVTILLMFCEDNPDTVRMNAEESLYKVVRFCERNGYMFRVQIDLYQEIRKNGNERSLRISMNLFANNCHLIKQRRIRSYALNLLPCINAIALRKETLLIETLAEFLKTFCKYFQIVMNENETVKLMQVFINDTISDCAVKRRCSAQNVITIIGNSRKRDGLIRMTFNYVMDILMKDQRTNTVVGSLGFLRLLMPLMLNMKSCDVGKVIEFYEVCLQYLNEKNHSIINASLEVILVMISNAHGDLKRILTNPLLEHKQILLESKLKRAIFEVNNTAIVNPKLDEFASISNSTMIQSDFKNIGGIDQRDEGVETKLSVEEDEQFLNFSECDTDPFNITGDCEPIQMSTDEERTPKKSNPNPEASGEPWHKQKSTESIGTFFNSLLTHPSTETVSNFFRAQKSTDSNPNTPKKSRFFIRDEKVVEPVPIAVSTLRADDDTLSIESLSSHLSTGSYMSNSFFNDTPHSTGLNEIHEEHMRRDDLLKDKPLSMNNLILDVDNDEIGIECTSLHSSPVELIDDRIDGEGCSNIITIGTIYDQTLIDYTARVVTSNFLLTGKPGHLTLDSMVRVSIKNLSLTVIAECISLSPEVLLLALQFFGVSQNVVLIDTDISEHKKSNIMEDSSVILREEKPKSKDDNIDDQLLDMKDDHFGEDSSKNNRISKEFLAPLSRSADQLLIEQLQKLNTKHLNEPVESTSVSSSKGLNVVMSKSEIIETRKLSFTENQAINQSVNQNINNSENQQLLADILIYADHSDPIIRGDSQLIIGNFLKSIHNQEYSSLENFLQVFDFDIKQISHIRFTIEEFIDIVIKGLKDEIHTVVKHALNTAEKIFPLLMSTKIEMQEDGSTVINNSPGLKRSEFYERKYHEFMAQLILVKKNKYWLVQCKLSELIATFDYDQMKKMYETHYGRIIETKLTGSLYEFLSEPDSRVRNAAAIAIANNTEHSINSHQKFKCIINDGTSALYRDFLNRMVFKELPEMIQVLSCENRNSWAAETINKKLVVDVFILSNQLLKVEDRNCQMGVVNAIKQLMQKYSPLNFFKTWNEFNLLKICSNYFTTHYSLATDLNNQSDLILITTQLILGDIIGDIKNVKIECVERDGLVEHIMKVLNIYHHLFKDFKPISIPKSQKNDLFVNAKEQQQINSVGYFGDNPFYMRLYQLLRYSLETYKISITKDASVRLMTLLKTCLTSLGTLMEVSTPQDYTKSLKFIEELISYLSGLINVLPVESIICLKQMLKFSFGANFIAKRNYYKYFMEMIEADNVQSIELKNVVAAVNEFWKFARLDTQHLQIKHLDFQNIKLFEPLVIQCLRLFTKFNSRVQSAVLDTLCQLLEFNVNYSLLDPNGLLIDFILNQLEMIENGTIRKCELIIPKIIRLFFHLTRNRDKKLINVPKIIHITDNLLANSVILEGSILGLNELASEMFFKSVKPHAKDSSDSNVSVTRSNSVELREMDTQQEVVLSMLTKMINSPTIQNTISVVQMLHKENPLINESEFYTSLFTSINEVRITINNLSEYHSLSNLCKSFNENVIREKRLLPIVLLQYFEISKQEHITEISTLLLMTLYVENILFICDNDERLTEEIGFYMKSHGQSINESVEVFFAKSLSNLLSQMVTFFLIETEVKKNSYMSSARVVLYKLRAIKNFPSFATAFINELRCNVGSMLNQLQRDNEVLARMIIDFLLDINFDVSTLLIDDDSRKAIDKEIVALIITRDKLKQASYKNWNVPSYQWLIENHFGLIIKYIPYDVFNNLLSSSDLYDTLMDKLQNITVVQLPPRDMLFILHSLHNCNDQNMVRTLEFVITNIIPLRNTAVELIADEICKDIIMKLQETNKTDCFTKDERLRILNVIESNGLQKSSTLSTLYHWLNDGINPNSNEIKQMEHVKTILDETWFQEQAIRVSLMDNIDGFNKAIILNEIKPEAKLYQIISTVGFNLKDCGDFFAYSIQSMIRTFKNNCILYSPHINYLKIPILLTVSFDTLIKHINLLLTEDGFQNVTPNGQDIFLKTILVFTKLLRNLEKLETVCHSFLEKRIIEKFFSDNFLKPDLLKTFIEVVVRCALYIDHITQLHQANQNCPYDEIIFCMIAIHTILRQPVIWTELNQLEKYKESISKIVNTVFDVTKHITVDNSFVKKYYIVDIFESSDYIAKENGCKALFLSKLLEVLGKKHMNNPQVNEVIKPLGNFSIQDSLIPVVELILRTDMFYTIAVTPFEILVNCKLNLDDAKLMRLPSISIDHLNDAETLEKFIKRMNIFGFTSRQQFEEFFMTLLVLVNKTNDVNMIDPSEEYEIRHLCLTAIIELLLSCHTYPQIGDHRNRFQHYSRMEKFKFNSICIKKLHQIHQLIPNRTVFNVTNIERITEDNKTRIDVGSLSFNSNQFDLNYVWSIIECKAQMLKNVLMINGVNVIEQSGIDRKSSIQLIFDVFSQIIETNKLLALPYLMKLIEICENQEQFRWIKDTILKEQTSIPMDNTICHQYIIYLLCRSYAVLVPSLNELQHLCSLISTYLKSTHLFIRNSTLRGLLCLFECCVKQNTSLGTLSEELVLLRNVAIPYLQKHGIDKENTSTYSETHLTLVWSLNFYIIETTSRFVPDCNLLQNTIKMASTYLKQSCKLDLYRCILLGLERLIVLNIVGPVERNKIEKITMELVKIENENFALPGLKLLISCMYVGASQQLENTERHNGVVQDDPEVIVQLTEKIDLLFQRIKTSTPVAAGVIGDVLCQIIRDLVPPKEILTKVIKELLTLSQPYCDVIAKILYQVFRSAIDSSYHQLLQEWLICSLPNFVVLPIGKAVWCLNIIFISASINVQLIKLFPLVLAQHKALKIQVNTEDLTNLFYSLQDFYSRLDNEQKRNFIKAFQQCKFQKFHDMINALQ